MRVFLIATMALVVGIAPLAAQERLERTDTEGADRICYYRSLLPEIQSSRERVARVGLGEPCPRVASLEDSSGSAPRTKVPMLASLVGRSESAGRTVCIYRFGTDNYAVPVSAGQSCRTTPSGH